MLKYPQACKAAMQFRRPDQYSVNYAHATMSDLIDLGKTSRSFHDSKRSEHMRLICSRRIFQCSYGLITAITIDLPRLGELA